MPRTIVYKALVMPAFSAGAVFGSQRSRRWKSSICVFHQRFSTNTTPQWRLAHPFRLLAHNGEISSTISGNGHFMGEWRGASSSSARICRTSRRSPRWCRCRGSDSETLDNMLELLLAGGMDLFQAVRALIPPAWQNVENLDPEVRAFHEYNSLQMEPWDGPAGVVLTDGRYAVWATDRNGLRPTRYVITRDRIITLASESGRARMADPAEVVEKGACARAKLLAIDTKIRRACCGRRRVDRMLAERQPYKQWLKRHLRRLESSLLRRPGCARPAAPGERGGLSKAVSADPSRSATRFCARSPRPVRKPSARWAMTTPICRALRAARRSLLRLFPS